MEALLQQGQILLAEYGLRIITALAIFFIGKWVALRLSRVLTRIMERAGVEATLVTFTKNLAYMAMLVFVVLAALNQIGIQTTSFIAVIGAAGLAVGLAMQDSLSNFAAGVMMIVLKFFRVGDYIEAAGTAGTVEEIRIFMTRLRTPDNRVIYVPNGKIIAGTIVNITANATRRIDLLIGIGYDDDIQQAKQILEDILAADSRILPEPAPAILVAELADSSIQLAVRPWVNTGDYGAARSDLLQAIKERFDQAGISIPYPQTDVHLYQSEREKVQPTA